MPSTNRTPAKRPWIVLRLTRSAGEGFWVVKVAEDVAEPAVGVPELCRLHSRDEMTLRSKQPGVLPDLVECIARLGVSHPRVDLEVVDQR